MSDVAAEETRSVTSLTDDEDFGFVSRDSNLLEKAVNPSSTGSEGVEEGEQDVVPSGEVDDVERSSVGGDVVEDSDVVRGLGELRVEDVDVKEVPQPKKGILKKSPEGREIVDSYDVVKRRSTVESTPPADQEKGKRPSGLLKKMATKSVSAGPVKEDLPQSFQVKYLGYRDARGLWGIKHTRRPVDAMVAAAKSLKVGTVLPLVKLTVTKTGVGISPLGQKSYNNNDEGQIFHSIDTISYGVQDLVYTRVFSMIVVKDTGGNVKDVHPFECHAFVCDSRHGARRLTYSLATAFQEYSKMVNMGAAGGREKVAQIKKRFAIDLRSPEEIEADLRTPQPDETEA